MTRNPQLAVTNVNSSTYDLSVSARGKFSFMQIDLNIVRRVSIYQYYLQLPFAIAVAFGVCMFLTPSCCWYRNVFAILSILIQMFLLIMIAKQIGIFASTTPSCGKCVCVCLQHTMLYVCVYVFHSRYFLFLSYTHSHNLVRQLDIGCNFFSDQHSNQTNLASNFDQNSTATLFLECHRKSSHSWSSTVAVHQSGT